MGVSRRPTQVSVVAGGGERRRGEPRQDLLRWGGDGRPGGVGVWGVRVFLLPESFVASWCHEKRFGDCLLGKMTARYYFKQSPAVENFKGPQQERAQCQDRPASVRPASGQWFYLSPPSPLTGQLRPAQASGSFVRAYFGEDTSPFSGVRAGRTRRFRAASSCPRGRRELPPAAASGPGGARRPAPLCAGRCPPHSRQGRVRRPGCERPDSRVSVRPGPY